MCHVTDKYTLNTKELTWSMLQSMSSLRSLQLEPYIPSPQFDQFIAKLKEIEGLKRIRGLKEFKIQRRHGWDVDLAQNARLQEVANEIRKVVLQEKVA